MLKRIAALTVVLLVAFAVLPRGAYAGPEDDMSAANTIVERALTAAKAGDMATALREYKSFENRWFEVEDGVRDKSRDAYRVIEKHMADAGSALDAKPPRKDDAIA